MSAHRDGLLDSVVRAQQGLALQIVRRSSNEETVTASLQNVAARQSLLTSLSSDDMQ